MCDGDLRLSKNDIKVNFCGKKNVITKKEGGFGLMDTLNKIVEETKHNKLFTLNLAIGYGGRQEILNAMKSWKLNEETIKQYLWIRECPDILIRTGGRRLSNFMLWQIAQTELFMMPNLLWGDFQKEHLQIIINEYKTIKKNNGK